MNLNEKKLNDLVYRMVNESVKHFIDKWGYNNQGQEKMMSPYEGEVIDELDSVVEHFGWEIVPMYKEVTRGSKKYIAYICQPNSDGKRVADWAYLAANLNTTAQKYGMVVEHGKYKGILTNVPENEPKPKRIKRGAEPAAEDDKTGIHFFIIKPRSESNI